MENKKSRKLMGKKILNNNDGGRESMIVGFIFCSLCQKHFDELAQKGIIEGFFFYLIKKILCNFSLV